MCNRLGRKTLREKGMLDPASNSHLNHIRRVLVVVGKKVCRDYPRPHFTQTLHEKTIRVPHRPLFFNYMTRMVWEQCYMRDRIWCTTNKDGWNNAVRPARVKYYAKLERYYLRGMTGKRVGDYSHEAQLRRDAKLEKQGITLLPNGWADRFDHTSGSSECSSDNHGERSYQQPDAAPSLEVKVVSDSTVDSGIQSTISREGVLTMDFPEGTTADQILDHVTKIVKEHNEQFGGNTEESDLRVKIDQVARELALSGTPQQEFHHPDNTVYPMKDE